MSRIGGPRFGTKRQTLPFSGLLGRMASKLQPHERQPEKHKFSGRLKNKYGFTVDSVLECRALYKFHLWSYAELAERYNAPIATIGTLLEQITWKDGPFPKSPLKDIPPKPHAEEIIYFGSLAKSNGKLKASRK